MATEKAEPRITRKMLQTPTLAQARRVLGGKLPSVFEKYDFPAQGIVITEDGPKVPVYVASDQGFKYPGKQALRKDIHPSLEEKGAFILDPFAMCGEFVEPSLFDQNRPLVDLIKDWGWFNDNVIHTVNYGLAIPRAGLVFAICEGAVLDDGMSAEIAYAATNFCPVVAARSDFHLNENVATGINPAVRVFAHPRYHGGSYHENPIEDSAYQSAFNAAEKIIQRILQNWEILKNS